MRFPDDASASLGLGSGTGAVWSPVFPRWAERPGFWDDVHLGDLRLPRLFTLLLDRPLPPGRVGRTAVDRWEVDHGAFSERRTVGPGHAWATEIVCREDERVWLWALPDVSPPRAGAPWASVDDVAVFEDALCVRWSFAYPADAAPDRTGVEAERISGGALGKPFSLWLAYGASVGRTGYEVRLAQRHEDGARWETSLVPSRQRGLRDEVAFRVGPSAEPEGLLHVLAEFAAPAGRPVVFAAAAGPTADAARAGLRAALDDPIARSERAAVAWFAGCPDLRSEDPVLEGVYRHRWQGLRLHTVDVPWLPLSGPYVAEGPGFFRNFVTYSAQVNLREAAWRDEPDLALGILDTLGAVQREDGSFPGHSYSVRPARDFYHADFSEGVRLLLARFPGAVAREHLGTLRRYADWLVRDRAMSPDPAGPTMYAVRDQNETGQEYLSRYLFAAEDADRWSSFSLGGVDATVYAARLFDLLADLRRGDSTYRRFAEGARAGLIASGYHDVLPDGTPSPAMPATNLYAALAVPTEAAPFVRRWLEAEDGFGGAHGFPAVARSDPFFSPDGEWRGMRLNCPWSGRSWPMANAHLTEAAWRIALATGDPEDRARAGRALERTVRALWWEGRPVSYEHSDPDTGVPALYRGYDGYQHAFILDLILRVGAGLDPAGGSPEPFPTGFGKVVASVSDR